MGVMTQAQLRPLTDAERRAVDLMGIGADIGAVSADTRLSRAQIVAARDLASLWDAVKRDAAGPVADPVTDTVEAPEPRVAPEPEPVDTRPVISIELDAPRTEPVYADEPQPAPPDGDDTDADDAPADIAGLLERGRVSADLRARDLALAVDRNLAQLAEILETEERTRAVREEIERLEAALAVKRRELDALLPADRPKVKPSTTPVGRAPLTVTVGGVRVDRRLYYSEQVRAWARDSGREVKAAGRLPRGVVEAYVAAHPQVAA